MKRIVVREGCVVQAFRFALDPNAAREAGFRSHCGAARAAFNWAVAWVEAVWRQRAAEETYGVPEDGLTAWRSWALPALRREFNRVKHTDRRFAGWWAENSKEAYNTGPANASAAFDNYANSKRGQREGARAIPPHQRREEAVHRRQGTRTQVVLG
ncbi:helix-turn-helix domain-containing protein [Yinghuangia seranimata]|uniref:helix-turn-helix domain-containing protein n=1 Tax=Yinghuangia seranimata TaxID=408067 RepID=UPI00248AD29D|nr:helix-turn-helix domain-containing protein [Yinghuangia seranimata]MDI2126795.1 helix-turn-helix domain-containing protein [Yinghuangia seranimata]